MNWEAISSIAELVGAVGVILSLIYLAFQLKQNTKASKAATLDKRLRMALNDLLRMSWMVTTLQE